MIFCNVNCWSWLWFSVACCGNPVCDVVSSAFWEMTRSSVSNNGAIFFGWIGPQPYLPGLRPVHRFSTRDFEAPDLSGSSALAPGTDRHLSCGASCDSFTYSFYKILWGTPKSNPVGFKAFLFSNLGVRNKFDVGPTSSQRIFGAVVLFNS